MNKFKGPKYQRGNFNPFAAGTSAAAGASVTPEVSARLDGRANSDVVGDVYSGAQLQNDGDEYEYATGGSLTNLTTWLDSGSASQVWVERNITSGSFNDLDPGAGRHNLGTTRSFRVIRNTTGIQSCTCTFSFYDAASGGNTLQTTSSATWSAERTFDPCPICCFTPDTLITMADGKQLRIADVREGDKVLTVGEDLISLSEMEITKVLVRVERQMYRIHFSNGSFLEASDDHPLHVKGKGMASVNPTIEYKERGIPEPLAVGDEVYDFYGHPWRVIKIEPMIYKDPVFTFAESLFFANGILVY